ncbi:hypothetical protein Taro_020651 [Colocasia esculenta]|uniref:Uncharacterized protein n=1 Tax=Colocasia esculenta TaxID=4460 RepID=A0A843UWU6_COLES|nr:hypothetical protein [Colocasia esculenta]
MAYCQLPDARKYCPSRRGFRRKSSRPCSEGGAVRPSFPVFLPMSWMTHVTSWVPDAAVIRVAASLCIEFLSRLGCPSRSCSARSTGRDSCSALEGLSHSEVVSVSWDPHPREPVEGVLRATNVLELAAHPCFWWFSLRCPLDSVVPFWVPVRGGTGECGFPTWWRVQGPGWFCLWALDLVEVEVVVLAFLLLWPVRDWCAASLHDSCACCRLQLLLCRVRGVVLLVVFGAFERVCVVKAERACVWLRTVPRSFLLLLFSSEFESFPSFSAALAGLVCPRGLNGLLCSCARRALTDGGLVSVVVLGWLCFV